MTMPADTSRQARELQIAVYRSMGAGRRLVAALEMSEEVRRVAMAGFRARNPKWTASEIERAAAAVLLGRGA